MAKQHQIYQSVLRKHSFLGCDRELCMMLCLLSGVIAVFSSCIIGALCAVLYFVIGYFLLRAVAKYDLHIRKIYMRNIKYKKLYLAQTMETSPTLKRYW